jgi:hypothetical protein
MEIASRLSVKPKGGDPKSVLEFILSNVELYEKEQVLVEELCRESQVKKLDLQGKGLKAF